jgi:uncharacterized protein YbjT (DUF2867 family)
MKLAIFGGTGYVGQALVRMALDHGHDLRLLVRNPRKFDSSGVRRDARPDARERAQPRTVRQAKGHRYRPRTQLGPTSPSPKDPAAA